MDTEKTPTYAYHQRMRLSGFTDDVNANVYTFGCKDGRPSSVMLCLEPSGVVVMLGLEPEGAEQLGQALLEAAAAQREARKEVGHG